MLINFNDLPPNALFFAKFCLESFSFDYLIRKSHQGISEADCRKFCISSEQWKDAIYVAIKTMREKR